MIQPYDDSLIITNEVEGFDICYTLVDNSSLVKMYFDTFIKMGLTEM